MIQSGIPFDTVQAAKRSYQLIDSVLDSYLDQDGGAQRRLKQNDTEKPKESKEDGESILSKT